MRAKPGDTARSEGQSPRLGMLTRLPTRSTQSGWTSSEYGTPVCALLDVAAAVRTTRAPLHYLHLEMFRGLGVMYRADRDFFPEGQAPMGMCDGFVTIIVSPFHGPRRSDYRLTFMQKECGFLGILN